MVGALDACTCCASTLYAFDVAFGRVDSADCVESTRLIGSVVPCRRQPWEVHAHERLEAVPSVRKKFLQCPLIVTLTDVGTCSSERFMDY